MSEPANVQPDLRKGPDRRLVTRGGRREGDKPLRDPETCSHPLCGGVTRVTNKRNRKSGIIWRRHECLQCGRVWTSWQSLVDPAGVDPQDIEPRCLRGTYHR